jgi:hypothetical protein
MQVITLSCSTEGASIYYTTDGTAPTSSSTAYGSEIVIRKSETVKALAIKSGLSDSSVVAAAYTLNYYSSGSSSTNTPCYWINGAQVSLEAPSATSYGKGSAVRYSGGAVYSSGYVYASGASYYQYQPCYWIGSAYHACALPSGASGGMVQSGNMNVVDGSVYQVGYFYFYSSSTATRYPCYWKDGACVVLPSSTGYANSISNTSSSIYVTGQIGSAPYYWLDGAATQLAIPSDRVSGSALGTTVIDGVVYINGVTSDSSGIDHPCYWKAGSYVELSFDASASAATGGAQTCGLILSGASVYVGGYVHTSAWGMTPCYWKDGACTILSLPSAATDGMSWGLQVCGSDLIVYGGWWNSTESDDCYWLNGTYYTAFSGGTVDVTVE